MDPVAVAVAVGVGIVLFLALNARRRSGVATRRGKPDSATNVAGIATIGAVAMMSDDPGRPDNTDVGSGQGDGGSGGGDSGGGGGWGGGGWGGDGGGGGGDGGGGGSS